MSLLLADVGGTSSRWVLLVKDEAPVVWTDLPGFNPAMGDPGSFVEAVRAMAAESVSEHVEEVVIVYGAGCGSAERKAIMAALVAPIWSAAHITVENDLLGTARGLCGSEPGLVLILGTGMNAGYYSGEQLLQPMPSLGYVLGDEGSGADIGKHILADALYGRLPAELAKALVPEGPVLAEVIASVYRASRPQAYLASFTARLADHVDHPYVRSLLEGRFNALAELLARFFPNELRAGIHATGSVALGFRGILSDRLAGYGAALKDVQRDPLAGLVRFHRPRTH